MEHENLISNWDGKKIITHYDDVSNSWIIIAIHSIENSRAAGGLRMKNYASFKDALKDALRLSKAMTHKFAMVNMNWGGGKSVIYIPAKITNETREKILTRFGKLLTDLNGKYFVGPDIGTSSTDMDFLYNLGIPFVFSRSIENGGAGSSSIPTAFGVFAGIQATCNYIFGSPKLQERKILVQGVGNVGGLLVELLDKAGAKVFYSEVNEKLIKKYKTNKHFEFIDPKLLFNTECDIFSPCAQGAILNNRTIPMLKCKGIAGAANNQFEQSENIKLLQERGIVYAPDFVINLGGAMGITLIEAEGFTKEQSFSSVKKMIFQTLNEIYQNASLKKISTVDAAKEIAESRIDLNK